MAGSATAGRQVDARESCSLRPDGLLILDDGDSATGGVRILCGKIEITLGGALNPLETLAAPLHAPLGSDPTVAAAVAALLGEWSSPGFGSRALISALLKACVILLLRHERDGDNLPGPVRPLFAQPLLARAVAAVIADPGAGHSVASMAAAAGMSRSSFAHQFARSLGSTPMEFVGQVRMDWARRLLACTPIPVSTVAGEVGFSSRRHFSRSFRIAFGLDPSAFRRDQAEKGSAHE
jgi:AraC-like DNA-binding protein